jgi:hypothetical protein
MVGSPFEDTTVVHLNTGKLTRLRQWSVISINWRKHLEVCCTQACDDFLHPLHWRLESQSLRDYQAATIHITKDLDKVIRVTGFATRDHISENLGNTLNLNHAIISGINWISSQIFFRVNITLATAFTYAVTLAAPTVVVGIWL